MSVENNPKRLQYLAHKLLNNKEGKEMMNLLWSYFTRQPLLPNGEALAGFGNDVKAYLSYHEGSRKTLFHIENIIAAFENDVEAENKEGDK